MPEFLGLTREEEEEEEDFAKMQLLSLMYHKREQRFFSDTLKALVHPKYKPLRPQADPEWKLGDPTPFYSPRRRARNAPPPRKPPCASSSTLPAQAAVPMMEEEEEMEPSTDLADFASYFEEQ